MANPAPILVDYDQLADVLYVSAGLGGADRTEMDDQELLWRFQNDIGHPVGVTVSDFIEYWKPRLGELTTLIAQKLPVHESDLKALMEGMATTSMEEIEASRNEALKALLGMKRLPRN